MYAKRILYIIILSLLCFSCASNNFAYLFDKLTSNTEIKELYFSCNLDSDVDFYYKKILKQGKKNNAELMKYAHSVDDVNWFLPLNSCQLTKGDLAISILINVNEIDDDKFELLVPDSIRTSYKYYGIRVWWDWIHSDYNNREYVINQLKKIID